MSKLKVLQSNVSEIDAVRDLTETFEQIASIRIKEAKDQVDFSKKFINDIWTIYSNLRISTLREQGKDTKKIIEKTLVRGGKGKTIYVVITSTAGLSGEINKKIMEKMLSDYKKAKNVEIVTIGRYGEIILNERHIPIVQKFDLPDFVDEKFIANVISVIKDYERIFVYYEEFESISVQNPKDLELTLNDFKQRELTGNDFISPDTYLFEPSYEEVLQYFESIMFGVALSQKVIESKLAQFASRFIAMDEANNVASGMLKKLKMQVFREKRSIKDRRTKEFICVLKKYEENPG